MDDPIHHPRGMSPPPGGAKQTGRHTVGIQYMDNGAVTLTDSYLDALGSGVQCLFDSGVLPGPASSGTLTARMVGMRGLSVLFFHCRRLPDDTSGSLSAD